MLQSAQQLEDRSSTGCKFRSLVHVLLHMKDKAMHSVDEGFAMLAGKAFDYPYWFIAGSLAFVSLMCVGFLPGIPVWIDGAEALYALPRSTARLHRSIHSVLFNESNSRPSFVMVTGETPGENIFTWKHLEAVRRLDDLVRGKTVEAKLGRRIAISRLEEYVDHQPVAPRPGSAEGLGSNLRSEEGASRFAQDILKLVNNATSRRSDRGDADAQVLTFQDICAKNSFGDCQVTGIQEMGVFDLKALLPPGDPPLLFLFDGLAFNAKKKAFPPHYFLGHGEEVPCSPELPRPLLSLFYRPDQLRAGSQPGLARAGMTCINRAAAFLLVYEVADRPAWQRRNEDWEKVLIEVLNDNAQFGPLRVSVNAFRSRDDALRASTSESSDVLFVALTFALLVCYSTGLNFSCDLYRSKSYPALAGVLASILGMVAGMGLMSLCGIAFVPTALVCPFLVVGVGIDDMFVIINAYSLAYMVDSARDRCVLALRDTGMAITITTITSLISFVIGLNTDYLSIKNFCWFCGAGMFFGYIFVLTFFFPISCLDAKREEENVACLFCVPSDQRREARREELRREGVVFCDKADISTFTLGALMVRRHEQDALRRFAIRREGGKQAGSQAGKQAGNQAGSQAGKLERIKRSLRRFSDALLSRVALDAHRVGIERQLPPHPSNGVLCFKGGSGDPIADIARQKEIPLYYTSNITGEQKLFIPEPNGTVGQAWRKLLINYYGPLLVHPITKAVVLIGFSAFIAVGMYGCSKLQSGLDMKDLAPKGSYLNEFDATSERFFRNYDFPVDVFFPERQRWWDRGVQKSMRELEATMRETGSGKLVNNPLIRMLDDPELAVELQSGNRERFERVLFNALSLENGKYKQFEQNFVWEGPELRAWKMQILPASMRTSAERASWMLQIRKDCDNQLDHAEPLVVMAYNYMMTFYESDLQINGSVTSNMLVAAITMLMVAMLGIPQLLAGFLVILIMGMIDVGVIGFMYFWEVKLNMVSMICLLLSIGFSVDYSAHVCHTFIEAEGQTRDQRAVECLVLMGNPVFHGAASSILGVLMLGFSSSYIFRVFFKMMTMVTVFALLHSVVFLPVLLSLLGSSKPHASLQAEKPLIAPPRRWGGKGSTQERSRQEKRSATHQDGRSTQDTGEDEWVDETAWIPEIPMMMMEESPARKRVTRKEEI